MNGSSQNSISGYGKVGLNRIGVLYEIGVSDQFGQHTFHLGARFYGPDLVFEKNHPGLQFGYGYSFLNLDKMSVQLGIDFGAYHENKGTSNLWVFDPKITLGPKWRLSDHLMIQLSAGAGTVINKVEVSNAQNIETYNYLNYELALGITYRFWNSSDQ